MGESYSPRRLPPKTASRFLPTLPPSPVLMFYRSGPPQAPASPPHPEYYLPLAEDKFSTGCLREDLDRPSSTLSTCKEEILHHDFLFFRSSTKNVTSKDTDAKSKRVSIERNYKYEDGTCRKRQRKKGGRGGHVRGIWGGGKARAKIAKKLATLKRRGEVGGDR